MRNTFKSIILIICTVCAICCFFYAAVTVPTTFWGLLMAESMLYWFLVASALGAVVDSRVSDSSKEEDNT